MKEWKGKEAQKLIETILKEETNEEQLTDEDCVKLAAMIVTRLESEE